MTSKGIFIRTSKSETEVIDDLKKLLQETKLQARLIGAKKHEEYEGMKAFFSCGESQIQQLLKQKLLNDYDDTSIQSLTSALSIEDAFPTMEYLFKVNLREQIEKLAPVQVLSISKVPVSSKHPEVNSGRWIIVINIPEDDELLVLRNMGLTNRMVLTSLVDGKELRVRFYCRLCGKDGHIQWRCVNGGSRARSVEFLCESPRKKTKVDGDVPGFCHTRDGENSWGANQAASENIPCPLSMPEGIKNLVLQTGPGTLSVERLEAFINHVQNEPDPTAFAIRYYTRDINGLRKQMTKISRCFYGQTAMFSDACKMFMRLLRNALERLPGGQAEELLFSD